MDSDLSDYEKLRLENIRRNANFLATLGISDQKTNISQYVKANTVAKQPKREREIINKVEPVRSSKRIQNLRGNIKSPDLDSSSIDPIPVDDERSNQDEEKEHEDFNYDIMPLTSEELDDYEFEIYAKLKSWRLALSRELQIEPYKICQNRTLAELVRRRRNDSKFASSNDELLAGDNLLLVWGLGPSKTQPGGFGHAMLKVLAAEDIAPLFELSCSNPRVK